MSMSLVQGRQVPGDFGGELEGFGSFLLGSDTADQEQNAEKYREQLILDHLCSGFLLLNYTYKNLTQIQNIFI